MTTERHPKSNFSIADHRNTCCGKCEKTVEGIPGHELIDAMIGYDGKDDDEPNIGALRLMAEYDSKRYFKRTRDETLMWVYGPAKHAVSLIREEYGAPIAREIRVALGNLAAIRLTHDPLSPTSLPLILAKDIEESDVVEKVMGNASAPMTKPQIVKVFYLVIRFGHQTVELPLLYLDAATSQILATPRYSPDAYQKDVIQLSNHIAENFPLAFRFWELGGPTTCEVAIKLLRAFAEERIIKEEPKRRRYFCVGCGRRLPWSDGAADHYPHHCDMCWSLINESKKGPVLKPTEWHQYVLGIDPGTKDGDYTVRMRIETMEDGSKRFYVEDYEER